MTMSQRRMTRCRRRMTMYRRRMITRRWKILCRSARLEVVERGFADGKLEQFMVSARND